MENILAIFFGIYVIAISAEAIHDYKQGGDIYYWKDMISDLLKSRKKSI